MESQVDCWEKCSFPKKPDFVQTVVDHEEKCKTAIDVGLQTLTVAYQNAPTKSLRTQILSIYADRFSANELKRISHLKTSPIDK